MEYEITEAESVKEGNVQCRTVGGLSLLLSRVNGEVRAVQNRCPHLGLSMKRGDIDSDGVLTCPWHGSRFDVCTGENIDWVNSVAGMKVPVWSRSLIALGREPASLKIFPTRCKAGRVFVEISAD